MASGLQMVLSHVIGMSSKLDDLQSLHEALQQPSSMPDNVRHDIGQYSALASDAKIKAITLTIGEGHGGQPTEVGFSSIGQSDWSKDLKKRPAQAVELVSHLLQDFVPLKGSPEMGISRYEGETVFVEWKAMPVPARHKIMQRVQDLAVLLGAPKHPSFRTLRCKGITRDAENSNIGFVFEIHGNEDLQPPRPSRTMFGISPSVTERVKLALEVTQSLRHFHTAGWLHKNLRSENVLLVSPEDTALSRMSSLSDPMLAGFAFSRLDAPFEVSEQPSVDPQRDIYRHPEAMGKSIRSTSVLNQQNFALHKP